MFKFEFKPLKMFSGATVAAIVFIVLVMRLFAAGGTLNDEKAIQAICKAIATDYGVETDYINLNDTSVSKPILKIKTKQKAVVLAKYEVQDDNGMTIDEGKKYYRVKYNNLTGKWGKPYETSAFWYYTKF